MALPPSVPTSFVPRQTTSAPRHRAGGGENPFLVAGVLLLGIAILGAGATFAYEKYLESLQVSKAATLKKAQQSIDETTVQSFIRLEGRLKATKTLLDNHIAASEFFDTLEALTLQNVRFSSLTLSIAGDHTGRVQMGGTARTFNALAAESRVFAADSRIKRAIFSGIAANKDGSVAFTLSADLNSAILLAKAPAAAAALPVQTVATSSPAAATTTSATTTP